MSVRLRDTDTMEPGSRMGAIREMVPFLAVENLIAVAHPDFRAELRKEANKYMYF